MPSMSVRYETRNQDTSGTEVSISISVLIKYVLKLRKTLVCRRLFLFKPKVLIMDQEFFLKSISKSSIFKKIFVLLSISKPIHIFVLLVCYN